MNTPKQNFKALKVHNISQKNTVANSFLAELRNVEVQNDRLRFRKNLNRMGEILAYEMSSELDYISKNIKTPLSDISQRVVAKQPVLISIMRAGLPFFEGIQNFFDHTNAGFIGAFRASNFSESGKIDFSYMAVPDLTGETVVIADPMLATGKSIVDTINNILSFGRPAKIFLLVVIAAPEGIEYIEKNCDIPLQLWCGAIDEKLDSRAYIVPGLGDAGDLAYGPKL